LQLYKKLSKIKCFLKFTFYPLTNIRKGYGWLLVFLILPSPAGEGLGVRFAHGVGGEVWSKIVGSEVLYEIGEC